MSELSTAKAILRSAASGPAWHGPSVAQLLEGVTAECAATTPIPNVHSIWELLLHMDAWQVFALRLCEGDRVPMLEGDDNWPPVKDRSDAEWDAAKASFMEHAHAIGECIATWDDAKLREPVPGAEFPFKVLLHGVAHHNLYHAGQIAILKKAAL